MMTIFTEKYSLSALKMDKLLVTMFFLHIYLYNIFRYSLDHPNLYFSLHIWSIKRFLINSHPHNAKFEILIENLLGAWPVELPSTPWVLPVLPQTPQSSSTPSPSLPPLTLSLPWLIGSMNEWVWIKSERTHANPLEARRGKAGRGKWRVRGIQGNGWSREAGWGGSTPRSPVLKATVARMTRK